MTGTAVTPSGAVPSAAVPLRIGADGSWMQWPMTGIRRVLDGVLPALAGMLAPEDRLTVYYNARPSWGLRRFAEPRVQERFARMPNRVLWNQLRLPLELRRAGCDVYLGSAIVTPALAPCPVVPLVHDCLAFREPWAKPGREGRYWRRWTRAAVRRAPVVLAVSDFVAADCVRFLGIPRERVQVVPNGVGRAFTPGGAGDVAAARAAVAEGLGVRGPYALQVGAGARHKARDHLAAAAAVLRATGRDITLVWTGAGTAGVRSDGVVGAGMVDDAHLVALYRAAAVVCVPSAHEGFGLPVLEALACGAPVVAARATALVEVGGAATRFVTPGDVTELAATLAQVLDSPDDERVRRREIGVAHASRYTWESAAVQVLRALRLAASR